MTRLPTSPEQNNPDEVAEWVEAFERDVRVALDDGARDPLNAAVAARRASEAALRIALLSAGVAVPADATIDALARDALHRRVLPRGDVERAFMWIQRASNPSAHGRPIHERVTSDEWLEMGVPAVDRISRWLLGGVLGRESPESLRPPGNPAVPSGEADRPVQRRTPLRTTPILALIGLSTGVLVSVWFATRQHGQSAIGRTATAMATEPPERFFRRWYDVAFGTAVAPPLERFYSPLPFWLKFDQPLAPDAIARVVRARRDTGWRFAIDWATTSSPIHETMASTSSDGRRVCFRNLRDGSGDVFRLDAQARQSAGPDAFFQVSICREISGRYIVRARAVRERYVICYEAWSNEAVCASCPSLCADAGLASAAR